MEGGQKGCVGETATLLSGVGRVTADSGAPRTGNLTPLLIDTGTPTEDDLDLLVLQADGMYSLIKTVYFLDVPQIF